MEAVSCGIPIIATDVGGNPEIVSSQNGILLNANPTPNDIANAFFEIISNKTLSFGKRKGSHKTWQEKYNASKNYKFFASEIKKIATGSST